MTASFSIEITRRGGGGDVTYRESADHHVFEWEFGSGDTVVIVYAPTPDEWPTEFQWAASRRDEVLGRIAGGFISQERAWAGYRTIVHATGVDVVEPGAV